MALENIDFHDLPKRRVKINKERRNKGKFDWAEFICWDGEGITETATGRHHYVLFANSQGVRVRAPAPDNDGRTKGISTVNALAALLRSAASNPRAIHVIYYGSYDFNMLLRDLPLPTLQRLRQGQRAFFGDYNIEVRFGKRLWVRHRRTKQSVTLWDVGSFFQQSFVKSLRTWEVPTPHLANIEAQKQRRSIFTWSELDEIEEYCTQELESFLLLMGQFHSALTACGLRIQQWHGPGAIAAKLYDQNSIKSHKKVCPDEINRAAQYAYGGGRIELIRQGHYRGRVFNYDVRSCYPYAISRLPSLRSAKWKHYEGTAPIREFSLYRISWKLRNREPFYPVRHRYASGAVCYPSEGVSCWLWTPEFTLLDRHFPGEYEVLEAYVFDVVKPERPFEWVSDMYYQRQEFKRRKYGAERVLKLGLNSLYGKMIQQIGWSEDKGLPPYHQLEWGGYVTSAARAQLYEAAYGNPDVISFETDGILTTSPLNVELSEELGGWELTEYAGITYVQTGFYWLDETSGQVKERYRGFDRGSVTRNMVLDGWEHGGNCEDTDPCKGCGTHIAAQLTRHVGLSYAMHNKQMDTWGNWTTSRRMLDIDSASNKRVRACGYGARRPCRTCAHRQGATLAEGLHDTDPHGWGYEPSAPYPLLWRPEEIPEWKIEKMRTDREQGDFDSLRYA